MYSYTPWFSIVILPKFISPPSLSGFVSVMLSFVPAPIGMGGSGESSFLTLSKVKEKALLISGFFNPGAAVRILSTLSSISKALTT